MVKIARMVQMPSASGQGSELCAMCLAFHCPLVTPKKRYRLRVVVKLSKVLFSDGVKSALSTCVIIM